MFNDLPTWFIVITATATFIGYAVLIYFAGCLLRPLARGLSYGLYETIVYYKGGAKMRYVLLTLLRAFFVEPIVWLGNNNTTSVTNNKTGWYGIFRWSFAKDYTRANSKKYNAECAAKRAEGKDEPKPDDDDDDFGI